jgi:hypothetical protein
MTRWSAFSIALQPERITSPETTPLSGAFLEVSLPCLLGTGVPGSRLASRCGERLW